MTSSLPILTPTTPGLTPNTRTEAEAALSYNAILQTMSAAPSATSTSDGRPSRPALPTRTSSNYQDAATVAHLSFEPPYPSDETAEAVRGNLSRGTTRAVLDKMEKIASNSSGSVEPAETLLSKRASREGARRTSEVTIDTAGEGVARPRAYQRLSYNQEDLKRMMTERLMEEGAKDPAATGYTSVG